MPTDDSQRRKLPCHVRAFADLRDLPVNNGTEFMPTVYALVEFATIGGNTNEPWMHSDLFSQYYKELDPLGVPKKEWTPVDWFLECITVIDDVGSAHRGAVLRVSGRKNWPGMFQRFIEREHKREFFPPPIGE